MCVCCMIGCVWLLWPLSPRDLGFPGGSVIKNWTANAAEETWIWSLGWEDPLEEETATDSSILAWEIPRTEEPGGYSSWGCRVRQDLVTEITWSCNNLQLLWRNHLRRSIASPVFMFFWYFITNLSVNISLTVLQISAVLILIIYYICYLVRK